MQHIKGRNGDPVKKIYVIRSGDIFQARILKQLPDDSFLYVGSLWAQVALTDEEKSKYSFPIALDK